MIPVKTLNPILKDWSDLLNNLTFLIVIFYFIKRPLLALVIFFHHFFQIEFSDDITDMRVVRTLKSKRANWSGFTLYLKLLIAISYFIQGQLLTTLSFFGDILSRFTTSNQNQLPFQIFFHKNERIVRITVIKSKLMVN